MFKFANLLPVAVVAVSCSAVGSAAAQPAARTPGYSPRPIQAPSHDGFMVRLAPGFGAAAAVLNESEPEVELSGDSASFALTLGVAIAPNFLLGLTVATDMVLAPTLSVGEVDYTSDDDVEWGIHFSGVSATHYWMPSNWYVTGALGAIFMTTKAPGEKSEREGGGAMMLGFGKEWWVSENWGLGAAMDVTLGAVTDQETDKGWTVAIATLRLSATYN